MRLSVTGSDGSSPPQALEGEMTVSSFSGCDLSDPAWRGGGVTEKLSSIDVHYAGRVETWPTKYAPLPYREMSNFLSISKFKLPRRSPLTVICPIISFYVT